MSWGSDVIAVRDWLVEAINEVWPGMLVATEKPERDFGVPFARVVTKYLEFHSETVKFDRLQTHFEIRVRREVTAGIVGNQLIADAESLRSELLGSANPAGVADSPLVTSVQIEQETPGDHEFDLLVNFSCWMSAARG
ncbi:MAG: hypothetical protein KF824_05830 [Fimbriimonadaceae bacterium]|nr:MAG: hypothetical protein KF824_05830 [Fimbriimonadaceae bacterium]